MSELIKLGFTPKHWRNKAKAEVDFIIEKDNEIIPIEVKINANSRKVERGLRSFIADYQPKKAFIVSYKDVEKYEKIGNCKVVFTNILKIRDFLC